MVVCRLIRSSEREKLLTEIGEVGVCDVANQQLGASVKNLDVHKAAGLVFFGMLPLFRRATDLARAIGGAARKKIHRSRDRALIQALTRVCLSRSFRRS